MDMVTASMCLYLLFPIVNERQNQYATLLKRTPQTDSEFVTQKLALEKFIGFGNTDEKLSLEYVPDTLDEFQEGQEEDFGPAVHFKNSMERLSYFSKGSLGFSVSSAMNLNESYSTVINKDTVTRTKYDSKYRVSEKIVMSNGKDLSSIKMMSRQIWKYDPRISCIEDDFDEKKSVEYLYEKPAYPSLVTFYDLELEEDGSEKKRIRTRTLSYSYDDENRILEESEALFRSRRKVYSKKNVYSYAKNLSVPDTEFFEDGILRMKIEYSDEESWIQTLYFQEGFVVRETYEDGELIDERIEKERKR